MGVAAGWMGAVLGVVLAGAVCADVVDAARDGGRRGGILRGRLGAEEDGNLVDGEIDGQSGDDWHLPRRQGRRGPKRQASDHVGKEARCVWRVSVCPGRQREAECDRG